MQWFEELPEQCPPSDAIEPDDTILYRIVNGDSVTSSDFISQRELAGPNKLFSGVSECVARAVSLFQKREDAYQRCKLPKFRNSKVIGIKLKRTDGLVEKTFSASHYSWWRSRSFSYSNVEIVENE